MLIWLTLLVYCHSNNKSDLEDLEGQMHCNKALWARAEKGQIPVLRETRKSSEKWLFYLKDAIHVKHQRLWHRRPFEK